jgi:hypothetical protein
MLARLIAATLLATGALAAPAAAAQLQPLKPCYVSAGEEDANREGIAVRGSGFTPLAEVDIYVDTTWITSGFADPNGEISAEVPAPYQPEGERPISVTAVERANPANAASMPSRVTALAVTLRPREARPSRRVRYRGRGFTSGGRVYAHYLFGGEVRKTRRLARRTFGACGKFSVRRRQLPIRSPRTGEWTVQIDQRRRYREDPGTNWVRLLIRVRRVFQDP